ncbi:membrane-spanning 4-domains subfamily A member 4A-like [Phyllobates terribilis]|uniref:membrane-spanning 4-domains subfamily A member 4A-like n=1 Tax=Phyllobates terribilis TaxID=111132 RepID=UPI003CCAC0AB
MITVRKRKYHSELLSPAKRTRNHNIKRRVSRSTHRVQQQMKKMGGRPTPGQGPTGEFTCFPMGQSKPSVFPDKIMSSLVILQQVSPQNNQPMESQEEESKCVPAEMPKRFVKFFQGEPEVLGVTQLFIGINHIFFGIIFTVICVETRLFLVNSLAYTGVFFWSGFMYVISGSLSIAASYKPSVKMVNASLGLNIISSAAAGISMIILIVILAEISSHGRFYYAHLFCAYDKQSVTCEREFELQALYEGILSTLLLLTLLEFCIALSTSIFGCKTTCSASYSEVAVVIYHASLNDPKPVLSSEVKTC